MGEMGHDDCIEFREIRTDVVDDQIDTLTRAFQGLSVACARCHDHKLDPIPIEDYYALYGILNSARPVTSTLDTGGSQSPPDAAAAGAEAADPDGAGRRLVAAGRGDSGLPPGRAGPGRSGSGCSRPGPGAPAPGDLGPGAPGGERRPGELPLSLVDGHLPGGPGAGTVPGTVGAGGAGAPGGDPGAPGLQPGELHFTSPERLVPRGGGTAGRPIPGRRVHSGPGGTGGGQRRLSGRNLHPLPLGAAQRGAPVPPT